MFLLLTFMIIHHCGLFLNSFFDQASDKHTWAPANNEMAINNNIYMLLVSVWKPLSWPKKLS